MRFTAVAFVSVVSVISVGCGKKDGKSIGAPKIEPPVSRNLPSGFLTAKAALADGELTTISITGLLKSFLYPTGGFVGPMERLKAIDSRMAELNKRSEESERACISETAKLHTLAGSLPGGAAFPMQMGCHEDLSGGSQMAFGISNGVLSLMERTQNTDGGISVLAQASTDGKSTEVWDIRVGKGKNGDIQDVLHIKASDDSGTEVTVAGGSGGVACGAHFRSHKGLLYISYSQSAPESCSQQRTSACYKADSLASVDTSECVNAGIDKFALTTLTPEAVAATLSESKKIVTTSITNFKSFNDEKK